LQWEAYGIGSGNDRSRSSVERCSDFFGFATTDGGGALDACGKDDLREGRKDGGEEARVGGVRGEEEPREDSGEEGASSGTPLWYARRG
jgi:hypothetical protein